MNKIPKCRSKYFIPQANNIKVSQKESFKEHLVPKITQKNLKFSGNRQFGKDITNSVKGDAHSIYNNHYTKIITIMDKKQNNNNVYIKKHSSASQVAQKNQKIKIALNEKKLRENKSGSMINKKNDVSVSESYYYKNNYLKNDYPQAQAASKLHSSISFGINENTRPLSSYNNSISVRLSNPRNNNISSNLNNRSIKIHNNYFANIHNYNNIINNNNNKIELTHSNLDLM
jgi:hypothetical protein